MKDGPHLAHTEGNCGPQRFFCKLSAGSQAKTRGAWRGKKQSEHTGPFSFFCFRRRRRLFPLARHSPGEISLQLCATSTQDAPRNVSAPQFGEESTSSIPNSGDSQKKKKKKTLTSHDDIFPRAGGDQRSTAKFLLFPFVAKINTVRRV